MKVKTKRGRPKRKGEWVATQVRLERKLIEALDGLAGAARRTRNAEVIIALEEYVQRNAASS